jgi:NTE family protein
MKWFVEPGLRYERGTQEIWIDGAAVADYQFRKSDARIAVGRVLGRWGEIRVAAYTGQNEGSPRIGLPEYPSVDERRAGGEARFRIDTADSVIFPTTGSGVDLRYRHSSESLGADKNFSRIRGAATHAWSFGKNTLVPYLEYGDNLEPVESFFSLLPMGGLFRLSGLGSNELLGEKIVLARVLAYRRLFQFDVAGMGIRIIAGLSLEAGNAYDTDESISWGNTLKGGCIFVGGETFIGPVIFAYGRAEGNRDRFYFAIGDRF